MSTGRVDHGVGSHVDPADDDTERVRGRTEGLRAHRRASLMHLYQGTTRQFIADATQARLANMLSDRWFDEFRYRPAPSEEAAFRIACHLFGPIAPYRVSGQHARHQYTRRHG